MVITFDESLCENSANSMTLGCIDAAITAMETTKEKWFEAEVHRIAAEIALNSAEPDAAKAEGCFKHALTGQRGAAKRDVLEHCRDRKKLRALFKSYRFSNRRLEFSYRDKHARFDLDHTRRRRFAPPWSIDAANNACFIVRDQNGQALGRAIRPALPRSRACGGCGGCGVQGLPRLRRLRWGLRRRLLYMDWRHPDLLSSRAVCGARIRQRTSFIVRDKKGRRSAISISRKSRAAVQSLSFAHQGEAPANIADPVLPCRKDRGYS